MAAKKRNYPAKQRAAKKKATPRKAKNPPKPSKAQMAGDDLMKSMSRAATHNTGITVSFADLEDTKSAAYQKARKRAELAYEPSAGRSSGVTSYGSKHKAMYSSLVRKTKKKATKKK